MQICFLHSVALEIRRYQVLNDKCKRSDFESIIESEGHPINRFWISNRFPSPKTEHDCFFFTNQGTIYLSFTILI